jgi:sortase A
LKRKVIGIGLIIIGLCIIGSALYMRLSSDNEQRAMLEDFEKTLQQVDTSGEESVPSNVEAGEKKEEKKEVKMGAIGIMSIPKIDIKVAVGEGLDDKTLKYAVGHFEGTAMPGEKGNFCVAGHRSYTYGQYFNRLDELKKGDEVIVKTKKGEFTYKITESKVVEPTEVSVLDNTKDETITLVTCTPVRVATHRLIVVGKLVK